MSLTNTFSILMAPETYSLFMNNLLADAQPSRVQGIIILSAQGGCYLMSE